MREDSGRHDDTERFYAPDAADRVVSLFRSFGWKEPGSPIAEDPMLEDLV